MSWLHTLLHSLNDAELVVANKIRLIGKEKALYELVLSHRTKEPLKQKVICKKIKITDSHYYKINSILLDKIFTALIPQGGFDLLDFLRKKELYAFLKTEVIAQKKLPRDADYYLKCFRLLIDVPYKFYDEKLTKEIGNNYLKSLASYTESDNAYIKFHLLFADCNRFAAAKNPEELFKVTENDLLFLESELQGKKFYLAQYYLYRTLCNYYNYYQKNAAKSLAYLQKAISLKNEIASFFPINIHQFLRLLYADALLNFDDVKQSHSLYTEVFKEGVNETMYGFYYHCEQFAIASILLKKYDTAANLLSKYFDTCIEKKNDIYATRGALTYAKLYLSNGEHKKAQSYINIGIEINEKKFYLPFEIQLRALENIYFFLKKDYDFAKQLAQRNSKFISNQKATELNKNYRSFFKIITSLVTSVEQQKPLPIAIQQEYKLVETNFRNVYCDLIPMMFAKISQGQD